MASNPLKQTILLVGGDCEIVLTSIVLPPNVYQIYSHSLLLLIPNCPRAIYSTKTYSKLHSIPMWCTTLTRGHLCHWRSSNGCW